VCVCVCSRSRGSLDSHKSYIGCTCRPVWPQCYPRTYIDFPHLGLFFFFLFLWDCQMSDDHKLRFYGLFQQARNGDCDSLQPSVMGEISCLLSFSSLQPPYPFCQSLVNVDFISRVFVIIACCTQIWLCIVCCSVSLFAC
jgi:hypothetical protein